LADIAEDPLTFVDAVAHASIFLTSAQIRAALIPQTVIVIGRTTLSRSINMFLKLAPTQIVIDPRMVTVDSDRHADKRFMQIPELNTKNSIT
jgi:2-succinyl-6-hydroxy-2,4-cyclohexadiene-1-carboxylate synthase